MANGESKQERENSHLEAFYKIKAMRARHAQGDETQRAVLLAKRLLEATESSGQAGRPVSPYTLARFVRIKANEADNARVEARSLALDVSQNAEELARALENNSAALPNAPENDEGQTQQALAASLLASVAAIVELLARNNV